MTLQEEYDRDLQKGIDIALPKHYFPNDDPQRTGQEMENAQYLEAKGVARIINSRQQIREINALLDSLNPTDQALGRQDSAERVVHDIQNTWQEVTTRRGTRELATLSSFNTAHVAVDLPD